MAEDESRSELERLRAEYRQARARATRKIASTRRRTGARLAGSQYDPRRPVGHEKRLNATQLKAGIKNFGQFTDRRNQYVAGAAGTPLPKAKVDAYNDLQDRFNRQREWLGRNIDNQIIPGTQMTYAESRARFVEPATPTRTPLSRSRMPVHKIENEKAIDTMSRRLQRRMTPEGQRQEISNARHVLDEMAKYGNDGEMQKRFKKLSDEGILRIYSDQDFMDSLAIVIGSPKGSEYTDDVIENRQERVFSLMNAAESYDR